MPVYAKQYGRLGNNLFQKAAAIGYAQHHRMQYNLSELPLIKQITSYSGLARSAHPDVHILHENGHQYQELPFTYSWRYRDVILNGYWQSEKYFAHCREEVLKAFGYSWELYPRICSVHVRRGDYLNYPDKHPVVTMEYLARSMEMMTDQRGVETFMVFSDDIPWCRENFRDLPYDFVYSTNKTAENDLVEGSCCEHNIISNSTFSWWQAWLNRNPDKAVISPSKDNWFGPGNAHLDTSDLTPDSWIQIKF